MKKQERMERIKTLQYKLAHWDLDQLGREELERRLKNEKDLRAQEAEKEQRAERVGHMFPCDFEFDEVPEEILEEERKELEAEKKPIRFCSIQLKMRDGESHWVDILYDVDLQELREIIECFLLENPEINKEGISEIILTT